MAPAAAPFGERGVGGIYPRAETTKPPLPATIPAPHRHPGVGRNPEPRLALGLAVGRGVDSRFRGNDGVGRERWWMGRFRGCGVGVNPPNPLLRKGGYGLRPYSQRLSYLPIIIPGLHRHSGVGRNPEPQLAPAWDGPGVDFRFRGNDGMGGNGGGWGGSVVAAWG